MDEVAASSMAARVREECFSEDIPVKDYMSTWSEDELRAFFLAGGLAPTSTAQAAGASSSSPPPSRDVSSSAVDALRRIVPWVQPDGLSHRPESPPSTAPEPPVPAPAPVPVPAVAPAAVPARPGWAIGNFPASIAELLEERRLNHLTDCFEGESVVTVALQLAACGPSEFLRWLEVLGVRKIGERQKLRSAIGRAMQQLQTSAASLLDPTLEQRLAGQAGPTLFAFIATFPRSEPAAVAAAAASGSISIQCVVSAIFHDIPGVEALQRLLAERLLGWLTDNQLEFLRTLAVFALIFLLDSGLKPSGALAALQPHWRLCEAVGLLPPAMSTHDTWMGAPLISTSGAGGGGAMLVLSPPRQHLWRHLPPCLTVVPAVMGGKLPHSTIDVCNRAARRTLTRGEIGILHR